MSDYDTELMLRTSSGETEAYRELFDRHYARAVNLVYRFLGDRDLAEDVAMEAFARVYESRRQFRGSSKFSTYLHRVLVNLSINAARRGGRASTQDLDGLELPSPARDDPAAVAQRSEVARAVRNAMLALPERQRLALVLTRYQELSYQDAAEAMGVSVKALESLLHRAKQSIRAMLEDYLALE
jgi:RNA polymerase sigma-70 factor, ECF subfamily